MKKRGEKKEIEKHKNLNDITRYNPDIYVTIYEF